MQFQIDSTHRCCISTVIAIGALALASVETHAANLDEVTVTVPGAKTGPAKFPWSVRLGYDPNTSVTTVEIGKSCYVSFVLTAFSAACTHDAVRGDLFSPKNRVAAVEPRKSALRPSATAMLH